MAPLNIGDGEHGVQIQMQNTDNARYKKNTISEVSDIKCSADKLWCHVICGDQILQTTSQGKPCSNLRMRIGRENEKKFEIQHVPNFEFRTVMTNGKEGKHNAS